LTECLLYDLDRVPLGFHSPFRQPVRQILRAPVHEYTQSLLAAVPGMAKPGGGFR
jgi:hypothetical protein